MTPSSQREAEDIVVPNELLELIYNLSEAVDEELTRAAFVLVAAKS